MRKWTKDNTIFIMASKGFNRTNVESQGIKVYSPYRGNGILLRVFREICFRVPFLPKTIWYNTEMIREGIQYIHLYDALITRRYLKWIKTKFPQCHINYCYNNMVGKAKNLYPDDIPEGITAWTYDDYDSRKYNIRLYNQYWINDKLKRKRQKPECDVFFVGRDKGRGEMLLAMEQQLQEKGLKTKFIITKNGLLSFNKPYYQPEISYDTVLDYDTKSRAILNITMENQEGVTMRDIESVAIGIKLITTNKNIANKDLYHRNNVYILGMDDSRTIMEFLDAEYEDVFSKIKENHTFEAWMDEITDAG